MFAWSPHPMHRPGLSAVGLLLALCGALGLFLVWAQRFWPQDWRGGAVEGALLVVLLMVALLPGGNRRARGFFVGLLLVLAVTVQFLLLSLWRLPPVGMVPSLAWLVAGLTIVVVAQRRRRNVRAVLEAGRFVVRARRQGVEHALPLERVREVSVHRGGWARLWGYARLVAHVRQGDTGKLIDRPLVAEEGPGDPLLGCGWDEEGRFVVEGAHPYRRVKARLEDQIRLARLPPKEREEAVLARRLSEDLDQARL